MSKDNRPLRNCTSPTRPFGPSSSTPREETTHDEKAAKIALKEVELLFNAEAQRGREGGRSAHAVGAAVSAETAGGVTFAAIRWHEF